MALPSEFRTKRAEYLDQVAKKYQFHDFNNLTNDDFMILGKYIQLYCFMELNLHRLFNKLNSMGVIKRKPKGKIHIPYIIETLIFLVESGIVKPSKNIGVIDKLKEIGFRRDYRNVFAHWAAKRIPREDAIVFFSGDSVDYNKKFKKKIEPEVIAYVVFDVADIRGMVAHLLEYEVWMAHLCAEIFNENDN